MDMRLVCKCVCNNNPVNDAIYYVKRGFSRHDTIVIDERRLRRSCLLLPDMLRKEKMPPSRVNGARLRDMRIEQI